VAVSRRIEREQQRRRRELIKQQDVASRMEAVKRAAYEVEVYQNHLEVLQSVHKECSPPSDWQAILASPSPPYPAYSSHLEDVQKMREDQHRPNWFDRLLGRAQSKVEASRSRIAAAKAADALRHQEAITKYDAHYKEWLHFREIAEGVLKGRPESFLQAITAAGVLEEIEELGSTIRFTLDEVDNRYVQAWLRVNGQTVIPKETKSLLKNGKLSTKTMASAQFFALYQDYVCSCVIRLARELFALLPIRMVFVHAEGEILNTSTGHQEVHPILSVAIPRTTLYALNLETIDPSDSMNNFVHRMQFSKRSGFAAVEALRPSDFEI
jgi:hypothetical protein